MAGQVVGTEVLAKNIAAFGYKFLREVNSDMQDVMELLNDKVTDNMSHTDHSLDDLRRMGHPYAKRNPQHIHDPDFIVHTQSGEMLAGKIAGVEEASVSGGKLVASAYVGIRESVAHAPAVIFGTSKMVPRDFLRGSLAQVKDDAFNILRRSLNKAIINFNGEKIKL